MIATNLFTLLALVATTLSAPVERDTHNGIWVDTDSNVKSFSPSTPNYRSGAKVDVEVYAHGKQRVDHHHHNHNPRQIDLDTLASVLDPLSVDADVAAAGQVYGYHMQLGVGAYLQCNVINGLFGDYDYDLGCACRGDDGRFFHLDTEQLVNVPGVNNWINAQVDAGIGSYYPPGATPNCDGKGGYTCPDGGCGEHTKAPPPPPSSSPSPLPVPSPSEPALSLAVVPSSAKVWSSVSSSSPSASAVPTSSATLVVTFSTTTTTTTTAAVSPAATSTPVSTPPWQAAAVPTTTTSVVPVNIAPASPPAQPSPATDEPCHDETTAAASTTQPVVVLPAYTAYAGGTTMTVPTVFVVEKTATETALATVTVTNTVTAVATATVTVTVDECNVEPTSLVAVASLPTSEAPPPPPAWSPAPVVPSQVLVATSVAPSLSPVALPSSTYIAPPPPSQAPSKWVEPSTPVDPSPAPTPVAPSIEPSPIVAVETTPVPEPEAPTPTPSPSPSPSPKPAPKPEQPKPEPKPDPEDYDDCPNGQQYDVDLHICIDICFDAAGIVKSCFDQDLHLGIDLSPAAHDALDLVDSFNSLDSFGSF